MTAIMEVRGLVKHFPIRSGFFSRQVGAVQAVDGLDFNVIQGDKVVVDALLTHPDVKALSFVAGPAAGPIDPDYDYTTFVEVVRSAADAYAQAGITDPRAQLAMAEVHDCFTPTELVLMEDLGFAARGTAWKEVLAGTFDRDRGCRAIGSECAAA